MKPEAWTQVNYLVNNVHKNLEIFKRELKLTNIIRTYFCTISVW
jgi:hypothetical protein